MSNLSRKLMMGAAGAAGGGEYIEDIFSTWLYTGNDTTQSITTGIDLAGEGGMVWIKSRTNTQDHIVFDTARGTSKSLHTNTGDAEYTASAGNEGLDSFDSDGFTARLFQDGSGINNSGVNNASWTFRKAPGFFDVVTYTGDGVYGRAVPHSLGSAPGCIIVKRTSDTEDWWVYHKDGISIGTGRLNLIGGFNQASSTAFFTSTSPTATEFYVGSDTGVNGSGSTYVAYLFAHDAGGFGDSGNESVIKCGSFTVSSNQASINLGWEPQFLLIKDSASLGSWIIFDNMRGMSHGSTSLNLYANLSNAEGAFSNVRPSATGVTFDALSNSTYIYIAIRRGPMKTPEDATKVFSANTAASGQGTKITTSFPIDLQITSYRSGNPANYFTDRLRGVSTNGTGFGPRLSSTTTDAESGGNNTALFWDNTGYQIPSLSDNFSTVWQNFRRAPGFFDVVAYTGTGANQSINHNLGVAPELLICKVRSTSDAWFIYAAPLGADKQIRFDTNGGFNATAAVWQQTTPTSTQFFVGTETGVNISANTFIAYLFATLPGISKVGSYTGTGTTLDIDCGFTSGARFVLIKRTDSTGDWYVWDTARGIVAGNDPYLLLNSTAAENTSTDYIDPLSSGFQISSTAPAAINANGGSFIFLAIA